MSLSEEEHILSGFWLGDLFNSSHIAGRTHNDAAIASDKDRQKHIYHSPEKVGKELQRPLSRQSIPSQFSAPQMHQGSFPTIHNSTIHNAVQQQLRMGQGEFVRPGQYSVRAARPTQDMPHSMFPEIPHTAFPEASSWYPAQGMQNPNRPGMQNPMENQQPGVNAVSPLPWENDFRFSPIDLICLPGQLYRSMMYKLYKQADLRCAYSYSILCLSKVACSFRTFSLTAFASQMSKKCNL